MPIFKFRSPSNELIHVESADRDSALNILHNFAMPDMERQAQEQTSLPVVAPPQPHVVPPQKPTVEQQTQARQDIANQMPWYDKLNTAAGGGARNVYLGAKNFIGQGTPEEDQERRDWTKNKEALGGWGTAGEALGEAGATLPIGGPVGKLVGAGGKVLVKAIPTLEKVGQFGSGKVLNAGNVARSSAESGASAGVVGSAEDQDARDRLDDLKSGATTGAVIPAVLGAVSGTAKTGGKVLKKAWDSSTNSGMNLISAGLAAASAATGSPTLWKMRAALNSLAGRGSSSSVTGRVGAPDMAKYEELVKMIQAKQQANVPLTATEKTLEQILMGTGRQAVVDSGN